MFDFRVYIYGTTAMLKEIYIENYKSLRNVTVQFKDGLNIIIGKNGSGKSNLLEFISKIISTKSLASFVINSQLPDFSSKSEQQLDSVTFNYKFASQKFPNLFFEFVYQSVDKRLSIIKHSDNGIERIYDSKAPRDTSRFFDFLLEVSIYSNLLFEFEIPRNVTLLGKPATVLVDTNNEATGEGPSFELFDLLVKKIGEYVSSEGVLSIDIAVIQDVFSSLMRDYALEDNLRRFTPINAVRLADNGNVFMSKNSIRIENLYLEFQIDGSWMPWSFLSDGTKRLFYLFSQILFSSDFLIMIDEPEVGIHPHQLYKLMQFLNEQSATKQIIISTHSPIVLDALQSNELDRIIIAKMENGGSKFERLTDKQMADAKMYMEEVNELSYYWLHSDLEEHD